MMPRLAFVTGLAALLAVGPVRAAPVDLQLVLALDSSSSVDRAEFELQIEGLAQAFTDATIIDAIRAVPGGAISVSVIEWSDPDRQAVAIDWRRIDGAETAEALARALVDMPRHVEGGATAIGSAILFALGRFSAGQDQGRRRIVDVSGDGSSNRGVPLSLARAAAAEAGVMVNGLAIANEEPDLAAYYRDHVIVGAGAFVIRAEDYRDFIDAIRRKLLREIQGELLARASASRSSEGER
jgi:hypothetical protein